jgi:thymidylate synthase (FAD)
MPALRSQDITNRQNSIDDLPAERKALYSRRISKLFADSEDLYREMVSNGVAKESARAVLPLNTVTRMYMHGTIRSFLHYVDVRTDPSTQSEHRDIAMAIKEILYEELPTISAAAFNKDS